MAGVAAAGRNGQHVLGVAFDATIISLNTANPNACGTDGCSHSDGDIARAVDIARTNGARVINISLGADGVGAAARTAIGNATAAGIIVVISAGNAGAANPTAFALDTANQAGNGLVIIAGANTSAGQMAGFSNLAGSGAQHYLSALGAGVRTFDQTGTAYYYSGTSFSAPVISGAAALLASAFPNLTGSQIVQLLLSTADDAGEVGRDAVYGNGILNIARAFEPQGKIVAAGTQTAVSVTDNGESSAPMGDANAQMVGAVVLDGYSRAYALDLARTLSRAPQERPLSQALAGDLRSHALAAGGTAVSITVDRQSFGQPAVGLAQLGLTYDDSHRAKAVAGLAVSRLTPQTAVALGFAESGRTLGQQLSGRNHNAFLVARDPMARTGFFTDNVASLGIRQSLGAFGLTVTSERGKIGYQGPRRSVEEPGYSLGSLSVDRSFGRVTLSLAASRLSEQATLLGARLSSAFLTGGSTSLFVDAGVDMDLGRGWGAYASYRRGSTSVEGSGAMVESGKLTSDAFAFDISKTNAFFGGDKLAFRVMQPLRVKSGRLSMMLPTSYDYATLKTGFEEKDFNLAPSGREIDVEAAYGVALFGGSLSANAFLRHEPGNIAAASKDIGGAIRFTLGM